MNKISHGTSKELLYRLSKLQPTHAYVLTWNRFIESNFGSYDLDWLHNNRTKILVGYYAGDPNVCVEHMFSESILKYIPNVHSKLFLLWRDNCPLASFVGSLNCENGSMQNLLVQTDLVSALDYFTLLWKLGTKKPTKPKKTNGKTIKAKNAPRSRRRSKPY